MLKQLLLLLAVILLTANVALAEPMPRIETEQPIFDFGEVMRGQLVEHTFVFKNVGDAELVIDRVKSTCGCTGVLLSEKNIPPGGKGNVKATFNSSRFKGAIHKKVLIYSNDPSGQPATFTVKGVVKLPLEATPARLVFGDVPAGQSKTISTVLTNLSGEPIKITNLRTSNTAFRAEVDSSSLAGDATTELRVTSLSDAKTSNLGGTVLIRLDQPGLGEISIPVSGRMLPATPGKQ